MKYSFDTSAFLNPWKNYYTTKTHPRLWRILDDLIRSGVIAATQMVLDELEPHKDEIWNWIRARQEHLIINVDEEQQRIVRLIVNEFPDFANSHALRDRADPFVIALAVQYKLTVVTDEKQPRRGVKIPTVCSRFSVRCISFQEFLIEIRYTDEGNP